MVETPKPKATGASLIDGESRIPLLRLLKKFYPQVIAVSAGYLNGNIAEYDGNLKGEW